MSESKCESSSWSQKLPIDIARRGPVPPAKQCMHVKYYCEENVWKLCEAVNIDRPEELEFCSVVFISNEDRAVPIWHQKIGKPDEPVVWDYHVIFLWRLEGESYVYDLDSSLPFPCKLEMYINEAIKTDDILQPQYHRFFRVIDAKIYLRHFASNRKHMLDSTGAWRQEPPPYPCIRTEQTDSNFQDFLSLDPNIGYGTIFSLKSFIKKYALHENNGLS
ncbi:protein N-terminal glutamine amidohydrolase isoform X1 [Octopus sinensis]|uniref:Protein N-terminal glutamine amidohydrolase n=1 Tax=Octopus sinensis TaxID=2607531 RepID=A0A6P7TNX0_9MOLL|nr:protein N-terminal glutamine amidohydrolase isoform X1 [Octopus sinensis]